jgi:hypothetical protein
MRAERAEASAGRGGAPLRVARCATCAITGWRRGVLREAMRQV